MSRLLFRWLGRVLIAFAVLFVLVYGGDALVYLLRGQPTGAVTINRFLSVPLKGQRMEFDYQGTTAQPCSRSLFQQGALTPCWQLRRNPNQTTML